jgi:hypothetical protein
MFENQFLMRFLMSISFRLHMHSDNLQPLTIAELEKGVGRT